MVGLIMTMSRNFPKTILLAHVQNINEIWISTTIALNSVMPPRHGTQATYTKAIQMVAIPRRKVAKHVEEEYHVVHDPKRKGQAMVEFIVAILAMILVILALVEFVPIFLENFGLLKEVREEAGTASLRAEAGTSTADRQNEFEADIPELLMDKDTTSGHYNEKLRMPAANLACWEQVRIPKIAGAVETLRYSNQAGTAEFVSAMLALAPEQALARAEGALTGAGWQLQDIHSDNARIFTIGDAAAPSAVTAVHAMWSIEGDGRTVITIVARSAGSLQ